MTRSGDVSDAVSHSTRALVTGAAAAAKASTVTAERRQMHQRPDNNEGERKKKDRGSGSTHLSHFHTQLALSPPMGKKQVKKKF